MGLLLNLLEVDLCISQLAAIVTAVGQTLRRPRSLYLCDLKLPLLLH